MASRKVRIFFIWLLIGTYPAWGGVTTTHTVTIRIIKSNACFLKEADFANILDNTSVSGRIALHWEMDGKAKKISVNSRKRKEDTRLPNHIEFENQKSIIHSIDLIQELSSKSGDILLPSNFNQNRESVNDSIMIYTLTDI